MFYSGSYLNIKINSYFKLHLLEGDKILRMYLSEPLSPETIKHAFFNQSFIPRSVKVYNNKNQGSDAITTEFLNFFFSKLGHFVVNL